MIDIQRLRVLQEVAVHGSFSKAANALLLTPSAVSQQIAALERSVGAPVVQRSARGTLLTEPGRLLVESAAAITAELSHVQHEIGRLASGTQDKLTVATFTSGGQRLLPAALTRIHARHPSVELTVLEAEPAESLALVRAGDADLALAYHFDGPPPVRPADRSGLEWTELLDDPMWIVLPATHRLAGRPSIPLAELAGERWVHGCIQIAAQINTFAALAGFAPQVSCSTTDYTFAQSLVAAGVGVALIPQVALAPSSGVVTAELESPRPCRHIGIAVRKRRPRTIVADLISELTGAA
jgi:DNA-binding transcriptional LysR family regulator